MAATRSKEGGKTLKNGITPGGRPYAAVRETNSNGKKIKSTMVGEPRSGPAMNLRNSSPKREPSLMYGHVTGKGKFALAQTDAHAEAVRVSKGPTTKCKTCGK